MRAILRVLLSTFCVCLALVSTSVIADKPQFVSASISAPVVWDLEKRKYVAPLLIHYRPVTPPLTRKISIAWKNRNGEGVYMEESDISAFALRGYVTSTRFFEYSGAYTITVILKNAEGEDTFTLPPLVIE